MPPSARGEGGLELALLLPRAPAALDDEDARGFPGPPSPPAPLGAVHFAPIGEFPLTWLFRDAEHLRHLLSSYSFCTQRSPFTSPSARSRRSSSM